MLRGSIPPLRGRTVYFVRAGRRPACGLDRRATVPTLIPRGPARTGRSASADWPGRRDWFPRTMKSSRIEPDSCHEQPQPITVAARFRRTPRHLRGRLERRPPRRLRCALARQCGRDERDRGVAGFEGVRGIARWRAVARRGSWIRRRDRPCRGDLRRPLAACRRACFGHIRARRRFRFRRRS